MKYLIPFFLFTVYSNIGFSQIFESEANPDGIVFPRMDTNARDALTPIQGQCIYNTDSESIDCYNGTTWLNKHSTLSDADDDTKVYVEKLNDSDVIHFDAEGTEIYSFSRTVTGDSRLEPRFENDFGGYYNLIIGVEAGQVIDLGYENTFLGAETGSLNSGGHRNTFIGTYSGRDNVDGSRNVFVGTESGIVNQANENTFIGSQAGKLNTIGTSNVFLGYLAGQTNVEGNSNTHLGHRAGRDNSEGIITLLSEQGLLQKVKAEILIHFWEVGQVKILTHHLIHTLDIHQARLM